MGAAHAGIGDADRARVVAVDDAPHEDRELERVFRGLPSALDRGPIADLRRALVKNRLLSTHPRGVRTGRFTVKRQIGGGAMGAVYEAYDELLDRKIALKLVRAENEAAKLRVEREARVLAKLNHPNVIIVHEIGGHEGHVFIAMELVAGQTLEEWSKSAARTAKEVITVFSEAGRGLAAAHSAGVIHCDFKPANAMIGADGRVRVVDFGLAVEVEEEIFSGRAGTPGFIAPERYRGARADEKSDQFSFAVALFRALFEPPIRGVSARIEAILRRGFHEDPQQRWPSITALLDALDRALRAGERRLKSALVIAPIAFAVALPSALIEMRSEHVRTFEDKLLLARLPQRSRRSHFDADGRTVISHASGQGWLSWTFDQGIKITSENITDPQERFFNVDENGAVTHKRADGTLETLANLPALDPGEAPWRFKFGSLGRRVAAIGANGRGFVFDLRDQTSILFDTGLRLPNVTFGANEDLVVLWKEGATFYAVSTRGVTKLHNAEGELTKVAISPDGTQILGGPRKGPVRLWNLQADPPSSIVLGHGGGIVSAEFSADGARAATASYDRTVYVWDLRGGRYFILSGHYEGASHLAFSPDGKKLATSAPDGVRVYDLEAARVHVLPGHEAKIWSASLSHDQTRLATASFDGTARIWHLDGSRPPLILRGHTNTDVYAAIFSSDDRRLATASNDGTVRLWDTDSGEELRIFPGHERWAYGLSFSPDGRWIASGDKGGTLRLWDLQTPGEPRVLEPGSKAGLTRRLDQITFSRDGSHLAAQACGNPDGACIFSMRDFSLVARLNEASFIDSRALLFIDDRRLAIARGQGEGTLHVWSSGDQQTFASGPGRILALALSADGRRIATGSSDGVARIFDVDRPEPIAVLSGHQDWVVDVRFDASGRRLVTASYDGTARIFSLENDDDPIVLRGHTDMLRFAAFAGEQRVVTASFDGTARVWNID